MPRANGNNNNNNNNNSSSSSNTKIGAAPKASYFIKVDLTAKVNGNVYGFNKDLPIYAADMKQSCSFIHEVFIKAYQTDPTFITNLKPSFYIGFNDGTGSNTDHSASELTGGVLSDVAGGKPSKRPSKRTRNAPDAFINIVLNTTNGVKKVGAIALYRNSTCSASQVIFTILDAVKLKNKTDFELEDHLTVTFPEMNPVTTDKVPDNAIDFLLGK